eukprot:13426150-Alexandrium_andersonii.AAC.1
MCALLSGAGFSPCAPFPPFHPFFFGFLESARVLRHVPHGNPSGTSTKARVVVCIRLNAGTGA